MGRPQKEGLNYFSLDVDFFSDSKVKILKARYGSDGIALYLYLLCEVYKRGYYLRIDDDFEFIVSDDLNMNSDKVKQVLNFLLERSLFDNTLFQSDKVLTSTGIQKRFQLGIKTRASKNPITIKRFWLLAEEETETFIKVNISFNKSENNPCKSKINIDKSENNDTNKSKVNKSKVNKTYTEREPSSKIAYFKNAELNAAFILYLELRKNNGKELESEQITLLMQELNTLSNKDTERLAIVKKATMSNWKSFYPISKGTGNRSKNNTFNNASNSYEMDMEELEHKLLEADMNVITHEKR
ncbi:MAG: DUF4373 domain-containing protein [Anaerovoracaceae bacterium]